MKIKNVFNIKNFVIFSILVIIIIFIIVIFANKNKPSDPYLRVGDIEKLKYNGVYPDVIISNGKIVSDLEKNQKIEIIYDKIYQYTNLNYLQIIEPEINIYENNKKIYNITSKIAYSNNIDNIKIMNFQKNASIYDLRQSINIKGELISCNIDNKQIYSDLDTTVIKDGFTIKSYGLFINDLYAIFKSNVKIKNSNGFYDSKIVDEFVNFDGNCDKAIFYINDNIIKMQGNSSVKSRMLDIKGDQIYFYKYNKIDEKNNFSQRILVSNGYSKYITKNNDIFYSNGASIDFKEGVNRSFILKNGYGYYKDYNENTIINFNGLQVTFTDDLKKVQVFKIQKGNIHQKKFENRNNEKIVSQFYSKGDSITIVKDELYSYVCKNGYGYIQDINKNNEVIFSGDTINYKEKKSSKINGNANVFDLINKVYVKGDELLYFDSEKIISSNQPFFLRQFQSDYSYINDQILNGTIPEFEKDFYNIKRNKFNILVNDISALKGKTNTETSESILEGNVNIIDYQNLLQIKANYATYSGKEEQIYRAEGSLTIYQYDSIDNILNKNYISTIIQSEKGTIYKKDNLAYFEGEPKIKNFTDKFFIKSDLLEAHLDTKTYIFKDNIKLLINTSENKEMENQIYILGEYAIYESEKKIITFFGPSTLVQKNIELNVSEIFVDFNTKTVNFKSAKESKIKILKY